MLRNRESAGMAGLRCLATVVIRPRRFVIAHASAICVHCDVRRFGRGGADRRGAKQQRQSQQHEAHHLHAGRRLRRIGQRMASKMAPAIPMPSPPMANANSHHVLKFSWFFQSMMWRLQKKS